MQHSPFPNASASSSVSFACSRARLAGAGTTSRSNSLPNSSVCVLRTDAATLLGPPPVAGPMPGAECPSGSAASRATRTHRLGVVGERRHRRRAAWGSYPILRPAKGYALLLLLLLPLKFIVFPADVSSDPRTFRARRHAARHRWASLAQDVL